MSKKILIIGSTGTLGTKLLNFCLKKNISVFAITSFKNKKKLYLQKQKINSKYAFNLSEISERKKFIDFLKNNQFKLVYFLDYGSYSLTYLDILIKNNKNSIFAIANKEMIIAGGPTLKKIMNSSKYKFIPLDSEHYSMINHNFNELNVSKVFIIASGGPFYFKKKIDLNNVNLKEVLNHPKWKMGMNNTIDSSNFINKFLEIFELSIIFNISLEKIDFLISKEAFVHSIIIYKDNNISINCFKNDMLISLIKPISEIFNIHIKPNSFDKVFNINNFKLHRFDDKRFKIMKYMNLMKKFDHQKQIQFMLLNNKAHKLYLNNEIKYNDIVNFIFNNLSFNDQKYDLTSFKKIVEFIDHQKIKYENI